MQAKDRELAKAQQQLKYTVITIKSISKKFSYLIS